MSVQKSILVSILVSVLCWLIMLPFINSIYIPLGDSYGIVSRTVIEEISPFTDIAKYLLLLLSPAFVLTLGQLLLHGCFYRLDYTGKPPKFLRSLKHLDFSLKLLRNLFLIAKALLYKAIEQIIKLKISIKRSINLDIFSRIGLIFNALKIWLFVYSEKFSPLPVFIFFIIVCWSLNQMQPFLSDDFAKDGFHFGEKIGLAVAFLDNQKEFFDDGYLLIHGFGLNVLPGIIGFWLGNDKYDMAFSRLVVYLQVIASILFSFLILFEIAIYVSNRDKWTVLLILSLTYFLFGGTILSLQDVTIFALRDRDAVFMLQALLSIRYVRVSSKVSGQRTPFNKRLLIYPALFGFSMPIGLLYVYDRSVYSVVICLLILTYTLTTQCRKTFNYVTVITLLSAAFSAFAVSLLFGSDYILESVKQIFYWSKVTNLFTFSPYPKITIFRGVIVYWLPIFFQTLTIVFLLIRFRRRARLSPSKLKYFLLDNSVAIFMLAFAMLYMRIALSRSDVSHLVSPGFFAVFSFSAVLGSLLVNKKERVSASLSSTFLIFLTIALFFFGQNSLQKAFDLPTLFTYPRILHALISHKSSDLISSKYLEAEERIKDEVSSQSCFYTLTSEGIWYRILFKKPCSRYWYLIYSTTQESQEELIQDLEREKPRLILYSNLYWSNNIDNVPKETSHLLVHQYVWREYRPYKNFNGHWFWIRRDRKTGPSELLAPSLETFSGHFDSVSYLDTNQKLDMIASGWALFPKEQIINENAILLTYNLVSSPDNLIPLSLGSTGEPRADVQEALDSVDELGTGWNVRFNRLNLPSAPVQIKAWAYNSKNKKFHEIPSSAEAIVP
ncbi:MAG: hypothetical protein F6K19_04895 [Cyanothece sp. SIO1E1]|nr:hypothetical protein [Cyanothece sp. SIO1E1]